MLILSFLVLVLLPLTASAWYLWTRAQDQYVSVMGFSVRKEDQKGGIDLLGGLGAFTSSGGASDQNILYQFIRSEDMVRAVNNTIDLKARFSAGWPRDFVYAYDPSGTIEDLVKYWNRQVTVLSDDKTGIITVKTAAFSPQDAKTIADAIYDASSKTVNRLSDQAREDATRYAREELNKAEQRVEEVRGRMTQYRTRTQLVDPKAEFESQMGILTQLQSQLAAALVAQDMLVENGTLESDPRFEQGKKKIGAIESRIQQERDKFSTSRDGPGGESYAKLVADYEQLTADRTFAEATYTAARATYDKALGEAQRQTRYLAAHIVPQLSEQSQRPNRPMVLALMALFLTLGWSILLLVYYSVRDRA
ncbi:capsule biosynthesis protein [Paracoccus suum]|nr:capsule biosynthesis protein [Paracoccus suum]